MSFNCLAKNRPRMGLGGKETLVQALGYTLVLIHAPGVEPDSEDLGGLGIMHGLDVGRLNRNWLHGLLNHGWV